MDTYSEGNVLESAAFCKNQIWVELMKTLLFLNNFIGNNRELNKTF